MKPLRYALYAFIGLVVVASLAVFLLTRPAIQKPLLLSQLDSEFAEASIENVSIGFTGGRLEGLELITRDGTQIELGNARFRYSIAGLLSSPAHLKSLSIEGLNVLEPPEMEKPSSEPEAEPDKTAAPFEGLYRSDLAQQWPIRIGEIQIEGEYHAANESTPYQYSFRSAGIRANRANTIAYEITPALESKSLPPVKGEFKLELSEDRRLTGLSGSASFKEGKTTFSLNLESYPRSEQTREEYRLEVFAQRGESALKQLLFSTRMEYQYENHSIRGQYEAQLTPELMPDLVKKKAFIQSHEQFSAKGQFSGDLGEPSLQSTGSIEAKISNQFASQLSNESSETYKDFYYSSNFEIGLSSKALEWKQFRFRMYSGNATTKASDSLIKIETQQSFTLPLQAQTSTDPLPSGELVRIHTDVPLEVVSPFIPDSAATILKGHLDARLLLSSGDDNALRLNSEKPLQLTIRNWESNGRKWLKNASLRTEFDATYAAGNQELNFESLSLTSAGDKFGEGNLKLAQTNPSKQKSDYQLDGQLSFYLQALAQQPFMAGHEKWLPDRPGSLKFKTRLRTTDSFEQLNIEQIQANLNLEPSVGSSSGELKLYSKRPFSLSTDFQSLSLELLDGFRLEASSFPLSQIAQYIPQTALMGTISGGLALDTEKKGHTLRSTAPIKFSSLSYESDGQAYLSNLNGKWNMQLHHQPGLLEYQLENVKLMHGKAPLLSGQLNGNYHLDSNTPGTHTLDIETDLHKLLNQPVLQARSNIQKGTLQLSGSFYPVGDQKTQLQLVLTDLMLKNQTERLKTLRARYDGKVQLNPLLLSGKLPLKMESTRGNSDLQLEFQFGTNQPEEKSYCRITGNTLILEDLLSAQNLLGPKKEEPAKKSQQPTDKDASRRDEAPFWEGIEGTVELDLDRFIYQQWDARKLSGTAIATPEQLQLKNLQGKIEGGPSRMGGKLHFDVNASQPYRFDGSVNLTDIPLGTAMDLEGWIKGLFSFNGNASGKGKNMDELLNELQFDLNLNSDKGTLYLIEQGAGVVGGLSKLLNTSSGLLSEITSKVSEIDTSTIEDITGLLQKFSFFQFEVDIQRGSDLDVVMNEIKILGAEMSIQGDGRIEYEADEPLLQQALGMQLKLGAKGDLAELLGEIRLLSGNQTQEGYYEAYTFPVTGNLENPKFNIIKPLKKGLTNLLTGRGNPGDALNKKDKSNNDSSDKKKQPEDTVKDILRGFF